jgi:alkaline phosphatase
MHSKLFFSVIAFSSVLALSGTFAQESQLIRFGLITDVHWSDRADDSKVISLNAVPRCRTGGLAKTETFALAMNEAKVKFVAELGDFTDDPINTSLDSDKKRTAALGFARDIEAKLALFSGPRYHVLGNHDTDFMSKEDVSAQLKNGTVSGPTGSYYYSFNSAGVHFVVLDAEYTSNGSSYSGIPGSPGSGYSWEDSNVPSAELEWLKNDLSVDKTPVIIFCHQPLNPLEQVDPLYDFHNTVRDADAVRTILEKSGRVLAVFTGHYHDGGYQQINGIHYVTLQANVAYGNDVAYHNQYSIIEVGVQNQHYRILVSGHGLQKDYILERDLGR